MTKKKVLLRYTNLASLFDILLNKRIFLLDPEKWEDKNDSYYIKIYKERYKLKSLLALCLTETLETYHHWKVFAGNIAGVCIEFDKYKLLDHFKGKAGIRYQKVKYWKINELENTPPKPRQFPFIKRYPYRDEKELRIIYRDSINELEFISFPIELTCINRVIISYLLPDSLRDSIKTVIKEIKDCNHLRINRTTLIDNKRWKSIVSSVS